MKTVFLFPVIFLSLAAFAQNLNTATPTAATPTTPGKDYSFTVPTNQAWTDTGLDLGAGEVVKITDVGVSGCGPVSTTTNSQTEDLPVASAPAGSLIARLHAENAKPVPAAQGSEFEIKESSHLFLGPNGGSCAGSFVVKVHVTPAAGNSTAEQVSQGEKLKQQLGNAAQIWLQGQLGTNTTGTATGNAATTGSGVTGSAQPLKVSDAPLDATLRKDIDGLPRRVNDQLKNQGDMVNFVLIGSEKQVQNTLQAADWHAADTSNTNAVVAAVLDTYEKKDYLAMPMSTLYLFGRPQDFGYEEAEPIAMVASRNHFRLWKAPFECKGQTVWVGAGTHDIGFAKDRRNGSITHKIDPDVDNERTNIGQTLEKSGMVKSMTYYLPPNPVQTAKVATGDSYHSDGKILVVFLK
jgi:LssY C-terminus